jgi:hypothetical protein
MGKKDVSVADVKGGGDANGMFWYRPSVCDGTFCSRLLLESTIVGGDASIRVIQQHAFWVPLLLL